MPDYVEKHVLLDGKIMVEGDVLKGEPPRREATPLEAYKILSPHWARVQEVDNDEDIESVGDWMDVIWEKMTAEEQIQARLWTREVLASGEFDQWRTTPRG